MTESAVPVETIEIPCKICGKTDAVKFVFSVWDLKAEDLHLEGWETVDTICGFNSSTRLREAADEAREKLLERIEKEGYGANRDPERIV